MAALAPGRWVGTAAAEEEDEEEEEEEDDEEAEDEDEVDVAATCPEGANPGAESASRVAGVAALDTAAVAVVARSAAVEPSGRDAACDEADSEAVPASATCSRDAAAAAAAA